MGQIGFQTKHIYVELRHWKNQNAGRILKLEGVRQVGKTFILKKFTKEQYDQFIFINMIGKSVQDFLNYFREIYENRNAVRSQPLHQVIKAYDPQFRDAKSTVVVIDKIQESAAIYSRIREFAREFTCDFIVIGSYLDRTREKSFSLSAGDTDNLIRTTLSFPEFLGTFDLREQYEQLPLARESPMRIMMRLNGFLKFTVKLAAIPEWWKNTRKQRISANAAHKWRG